MLPCALTEKIAGDSDIRASQLPPDTVSEIDILPRHQTQENINTALAWVK